MGYFQATVEENPIRTLEQTQDIPSRNAAPRLYTRLHPVICFKQLHPPVE